MKQVLLLFLLLAAATAHGQLFDLLDYREGVATLQINARLTNIYMYEARGEIDTIVHEFPASAVAFVYEGKEYHSVGLNDSLELVDINYCDSVKMNIMVWRDRKDLMGRSPYAEVTAIERLRAVGEVDTLGRIFCQNGDTIVFTHEDARWGWEQHTFHAAAGDPPDEYIESWPVLHLNEDFCNKHKDMHISHVEYYDRCSYWWMEQYIPRKSKSAQPCVIYLKRKPLH